MGHWASSDRGEADTSDRPRTPLAHWPTGPLAHAPKPRHLAPEYGAQFRDRSVAAAYPHRPPYPAATFTALARLLGDRAGATLDVGCGTGDIARRLAPLVGRVDAVDASAAMIAQGWRQPGGDASNLRWIEGRVEEVPLAPPYGLITAGESLHWLD